MDTHTKELYAFIIINVSLVILIGFTIYYTKSLWGLLGLFFLYKLEYNKNQDEVKKEST